MRELSKGTHVKGWDTVSTQQMTFLLHGPSGPEVDESLGCGDIRKDGL